MSEESTEPTSRPGTLYRRMLSRDRGEHHRASTPLECLFDLCFVVAVASAGVQLHHALAGPDPLWHAVVPYLMTFFAIWWAWMNFTWFASAYDTDDVPYRLTTLVQIAGVLVVAAGVSRSFDGDFAIVTLGYAIMRTGLVTQWIRAAVSDERRRTTAVRMACGVSLCMVGWGLILILPSAARVPAFLVMATVELCVPIWGERRAPTPWHGGHIAERYGLFTLIVLGETVLSATTAVQAGLDAGQGAGSLWWVAVSALVIVFAIWWLYFDRPAHRIITAYSPFVWGYGHYFVFASAAALGAGVGVVVDAGTALAHGEAAPLPRLGSSATVTVPVAVLLLVVWALHIRPLNLGSRRHLLLPAAAVLVLGGTFTRPALVVTAAIMAGLIAVWVRTAPTDPRERQLELG